MKTWRLATKHKNSFHETEAWSKGKLELIHNVIWQAIISVVAIMNKISPTCFQAWQIGWGETGIQPAIILLKLKFST